MPGPARITAEKRAAAEHAVAQVEDGMILGLGSGSTAEIALARLGRRVKKDGLRIAGIPTSRAVAALARKLGIRLTSFARHPVIDLTIDGADQVDVHTLALIKGGGGALVREKIVAAASRRMLVVVDSTKLVEQLGGTFALPVEVARFGHEVTGLKLAALGCNIELRMAGRRPFVTDNGNLILDCLWPAIPDPAKLAARIAAIPGVAGHGLFVGLASAVVVGEPRGARVIERRSRGDSL